MTITARHVDNEILCGHQYPTGHYCDQKLAGLVDGATLENGWPPLWWRSSWRERDDGVLVDPGHSRSIRGFSPTRRGSARAISGEWRRNAKTWPLPIVALCPACHWLQNVADPLAE